MTIHTRKPLFTPTRTAELCATNIHRIAGLPAARDRSSTEETVEFAAGTRIFMAGEVASHGYRILSGEVAITADDTDAETMLCGEGTFFGEMAALSGTRRRTTAVVVGPVTCRVYTPAEIAHALETDPREAVAFARTLAGRLRRSTRQVFAEIAGAAPRASEFELVFAIEEILTVLETDKREAAAFSRRLVRALRPARPVRQVHSLRALRSRHLAMAEAEPWLRRAS